MSVNQEMIEIKSSLKNYPVHFVADTKFLEELKQIKNSVFIIDANVWKFHQNSSLAALKDVNKIILELDEESKNLDSVTKLYEEAINLSAKKNLTIISIGGGILQDVTGFFASTLYRGVKWIFIPTTLLAQDDSCIGAKTSLNYKKYKNLIGSFFSPSAIYVYPEFLKTQKDFDFASGVGEMAKLLITGGKKDTEFFQSSIHKIFTLDNETLLKAVKRCLLIKKSFIEEDEFDTGRRNLLNYGHCFGHAIESSTNFAVPHGQAVAIGMIIANMISLKTSLLNAEDEKFLREKILLPILRIDFSLLNLEAEKIIDAMSHDKKNTGQGLSLIMLKSDFDLIRIADLTKEEAKEAWVEFKKLVKV